MDGDRWDEADVARGGEAGVVIRTDTLAGNAKEHGSRVCITPTGLVACIDSAKLKREENPECRPASAGVVRPPPTTSTRGKVKLDAVAAKVSGTYVFESDRIRRVLRANVVKLRSCYGARLAARPTLAGRVEIAFSIAANGKVVRSRVHAAKLKPADARVGKCFAEVIKGLTFQSPVTGKTVNVVYPFNPSPTEPQRLAIRRPRLDGR